MTLIYLIYLNLRSNVFFVNSTTPNQELPRNKIHDKYENLEHDIYEIWNFQDH
jgi:hypothetical protein